MSHFPVTILTALPLRTYADYLQTIAPGSVVDYAELEKLAKEGKLDGAYKQGRRWWINLLAHAQLGIESNRATKETSSSPSKGRGKPKEEREELLSGDSKRRNGSMDSVGPIRNRR